MLFVSAIRTYSRGWPRSSSTREPSDPPLRMESLRIRFFFALNRTNLYLYIIQDIYSGGHPDDIISSRAVSYDYTHIYFELRVCSQCYIVFSCIYYRIRYTPLIISPVLTFVAVRTNESVVRNQPFLIDEKRYDSSPTDRNQRLFKPTPYST